MSPNSFLLLKKVQTSFASAEDKQVEPLQQHDIRRLSRDRYILQDESHVRKGVDGLGLMLASFFTCTSIKSNNIMLAYLATLLLYKVSYQYFWLYFPIM